MSNIPDSVPLGLVELSDKANVSPRTIRYYIQQGLIPAPETRGPGSHYGPEYVDRLRLIKLLQHAHLPLSEIRRRIEKLQPDEIKRILETEPDPQPTSASEYVQRVLSEGASIVNVPEPLLPIPPPMNREGQAPKTPGVARSQWERFTLAPDVELHMRRPGTRAGNRLIERLLEAARKIFHEDLP